jgi:hypothetical protein
MTALAAWIAYSDLGPTSAYIATDSRLSWNAAMTWDRGKKCFASSRFPDIFGYVGEVLLPSLLLSHVTSMLDSGGIPKDSPLSARRQVLTSALAEALDTYPNDVFRPFTIVHIGRDTNAVGEVEFQISVTGVDGKRKIQESRILSHSRASVLALGGQEFVRRTERIHVGGSGAQLVNGFREAWNETQRAHTSGSVFSSVCEAIASGDDLAVGGPAQLVGLYSRGSGRSFGYLDSQGRAFFGGMPIPDSQALSRRLPFRNNDFDDVTRKGRPR